MPAFRNLADGGGTTDHVTATVPNGRDQKITHLGSTYAEKVNTIVILFGKSIHFIMIFKFVIFRIFLKMNNNF